MAVEQDGLQISTSELYSGEFLSDLGFNFDKPDSGSQ
jgi:ABC-type Fe3+-citrate transport system substrate-binding protein